MSNCKSPPIYSLNPSISYSPMEMILNIAVTINLLWSMIQLVGGATYTSASASWNDFSLASSSSGAVNCWWWCYVAYSSSCWCVIWGPVSSYTQLWFAGAVAWFSSCKSMLLHIGLWSRRWWLWSSIIMGLWMLETKDSMYRCTTALLFSIYGSGLSHCCYSTSCWWCSSSCSTSFWWCSCYCI